MRRFAGASAETDLAAARTHLRSSAADLVALCYDGYVTVEGARSDAIIVEGYERGADSAHVFAQRYQPADRGQDFTAVGDVGYLGLTAALIEIP